MITSERQREALKRHLSGSFAVAAACIFVFLASYRIQLPGLYYDEVAFVNAAEGGSDNTFILHETGIGAGPYHALSGGFESMVL